MTMHTHPTLRWLAVTAASLLLALSPARGAGLTVSVSADKTTASSSWNDQFTYAIQYSVSSTTGNAAAARVVVQLDPNVVVDSISGTAQVTAQNHNTATRQITFTLVNPLAAGSSGELYVRGHFASTTPDQTKATATVTGTAGGTSVVASVSITSYVYQGQQFTFKDGVGIYKDGWGDVAPQADYFDYWIRHGNTGAAGRDISLYVLEDTLPAGTRLTHIGTGYFSGTTNNVNLFYKTNKNPIYRAWVGNPRFNSGAEAWIYPGELGLPADEWVTGVMFSYGTVPGGGNFHPDRWERKSMTIGARLINPATAVDGAKITNCANLGGLRGILPVVATDCHDATVDRDRIEYGFYIWSPKSAVQPGESVNVFGMIDMAGNNATPMTDPRMTLILAKELEYQGTYTLWGDAWDTAGRPVPEFEHIPDFDGSGRTLLRWKWQNWTIPATGTWRRVVQAEVPVKVKTNAALGAIRQELYGGWKSPVGGCWRIADTADWDADPTTDSTCLSTAELRVYVDPGSGPAVVEAVNWVKGDLDADWSRYPAQATTRPGGVADYQIKIRNAGGVTLTNFVLVDILPAIGDRGVIDTSARGSQWSPYLAGPVAVPDGVTVYYSPSGNPCRDELTPGLPAGCEPPNWTSTPPADITTVRSLKIDFGGNYLPSGQEWTLAWPMRAPLSAPTSNQVAWNSFGYKASRMDNGVSLLPAEPIKTGIKITPPVPPHLGDFVWVDANQNGIQNTGEAGLNGVRLSLYRDNGDGVADPATDTFVNFTVSYKDGTRDGGYLFSGFAPGKYFVAAELPPGYMFAPANRGSNDGTDSDGTAVFHEGKTLAVTEVTDIELGETDRTWDFGLIAADTVPAVWAVAKQTDGAYVIGGRFSSASGEARRNIARLLSNGKNDSTFAPGEGFDGEVASVDLLSDGRVLVGGRFSTFDTHPARGYAILKPDGSFWGAPSQPDTADVRCVLGTSDGGMLLGGKFTKVANNSNHANLSRLGSDGKVDATFKADVNGPVNGMARTADGRLLLVGEFTSAGGQTCAGVARLTSDGKFDATFRAPGGANDGVVSSVVAQPDGSYLLTGSFSRFAGRAATGTVHLQADGTVSGDRKTPALDITRVQDAD